MPFSQIPGKAFGETGLKYLDKSRFGEGKKFLTTLKGVPCFSWERALIKPMVLIRPLGEILRNLMALTKFERTPVTWYIHVRRARWLTVL
jgi:hypothetical protein